VFGKFNFFTLLKILFRLAVTAVVILVFSIFIWRFITGRVPEELTVLSPNDTLLEAYERYGENLTLYTQNQNTITRNEASYGYFAVCDVVFIPEAEQVQILVRYNDSTLEATERDYGLAEGSLDPLADWYDVTLLVARDLTPDDGADNLGSDPESVSLTRILPSAVTASLHEGLYSYRRLVFDGVTQDELTLAVYADFYFVEDVAYLAENFDVYEDTAYGTLCLYAFTDKTISLSLTNADVAAIVAYKDERN
jgi:hypothetical protein